MFAHLADELIGFALKLSLPWDDKVENWKPAAFIVVCMVSQALTDNGFVWIACTTAHLNLVLGREVRSI